MSWTIRQRDTIDTIELYELFKEHRLDWSASTAFVDACRSMAATGRWYDIMDDDELVGTVLATYIIPKESASLELVPVPPRFVGEFRDLARNAIMPVLEELFDGDKVRRVTALVPYYRPRTKQSIAACGFRREGRLADGVKFRGRPPEDVLIYGMTKDRFEEVRNGTV